MKIYTTREFSTIITGCNCIEDINDMIDYCMINAVAIIRNYGASYYNALAYTVEQKLRSLENITV